MMRTGQAEKMEIIRLVEASDLSVEQALQELDVPKLKFLREHGFPGTLSSR